MKDAVGIFLSISAIIAGVVLLLAVPYNGYFFDNLGTAFVGVVLLAAGLTRFYLKSRFYKKDSN